MGIASDAIAASLDMQAELHGEAVTYSRSGGISIAITGAIQGDTNWDADNPQPNVKIGERSADWLIEYSQIKNGTTQLTPQRDDEITTADGRTFKVLPFGPKNLTHRWVDRNGRSWVRIHTKER